MSVSGVGWFLSGVLMGMRLIMILIEENSFKF